MQLSSITKPCLRWNLYALPLLSRLWIDFHDFRSMIENKVDWVAYNLALVEIFWITPGYSSESEVVHLMGEFHRNLDAFIMPRRINQALGEGFFKHPYINYLWMTR